jgi:hypothetical protein
LAAAQPSAKSTFTDRCLKKMPAHRGNPCLVSDRLPR